MGGDYGRRVSPAGERIDRQTTLAVENQPPLREDIRLLRCEVSSLRQDMADIRGRLTRVETLLEQNTGRPQAPESP